MKAVNVIKRVGSSYGALGNPLGISKREMDMFAGVLDGRCKVELLLWCAKLPSKNAPNCQATRGRG